jgi:hypothetical protein
VSLPSLSCSHTSSPLREEGGVTSQGKEVTSAAPAGAHATRRGCHTSGAGGRAAARREGGVQIRSPKGMETVGGCPARAAPRGGASGAGRGARAPGAGARAAHTRGQGCPWGAAPRRAGRLRRRAGAGRAAAGARQAEGGGAGAARPREGRTVDMSCPAARAGGFAQGTVSGWQAGGQAACGAGGFTGGGCPALSRRPGLLGRHAQARACAACVGRIERRG